MLSYENCKLCGRACGADRTAQTLGYCAMGRQAVVARAALHFWEEPPISGSRGSGAIFFSGCSLGCVFCQNAAISRKKVGKTVENEELASLCLSLQGQGAHNINFVTPTHFMPSVKSAVRLAKEGGLKIPIVYNTSSFDSVEALSQMQGTVDVYLPDFKYIRPELSARYSAAEKYPAVAKAAIKEMVRQCPRAEYDSEGCLRRGVLVRLLVLPGAVANAKLSLSYLYETYGDAVLYSIMRQYTPRAGLAPPLSRRVTDEEYEDVLSYAWRIGIREAFTQEKGSASEAYTPPFETPWDIV